jgi:hypothetical protein
MNRLKLELTGIPLGDQVKVIYDYRSVLEVNQEDSSVSVSLKDYFESGLYRDIPVVMVPDGGTLKYTDKHTGIFWIVIDPDLALIYNKCTGTWRCGIDNYLYFLESWGLKCSYSLE